MLIFDQLKKNDTQLQLLTLVLGAGLLVLLGGLWWVQIVNARHHRETVETQTFRTVRMPAQRGQIFDRNGLALAENRPDYSIDLYLEELSTAFRKEYQRIRPRKVITNDLPFWKDWMGLPTVKTQYVRMDVKESDKLGRDARLQVVSAVANQVGGILQTSVSVDPTNFHRHYANARAIPFSLVNNLTPPMVARFAEQATVLPGVDLEINYRRYYPYTNVAAHIIGYVRPDASSAIGEDSYFWYRPADYRGESGIEAGLDQILRGRAGGKSVQVNSLQYRQNETIWEPTLPGSNVVLTLDFELQREVEAALRSHILTSGRGAVVVMDVRTGDILAMASNPTFSPQFANWDSKQEYLQFQANAARNRAAGEQYQAGSVFKTIVALAALETPKARFNPNEEYRVMPNPKKPGAGIITVGGQEFRDTVPPGLYNLRRAIARSSNAYFIDLGLRPGVFEKVVELGRRLHLGERFPLGSLPLRPEAAGHFPKLETVRNRTWKDGDTASVCIGQGQMDASPLQIAVMISALANGGTVLVPRLIDRFTANDPTGLTPPLITPRGQVRDRLGVSPRSMKILHEAMLAETESEEGTGKYVRGCGYRVCGKTGTAELLAMREDGTGKKNTVWFGSFAPYESPRFAVVVMVENGVSGGATCVPIARDVYVALKAFETRSLTNNPIVANKR